jgi:hypothetical protein
MSYDSLENYYQTLFSLVNFYKWPPQWIENMVPWEKFIYVDMLQRHIKLENERIRDQEAANRRK